RNAPDVPELAEDVAALLVDGVGDQAPAIDLFLAVNARGPGVPLALLGYLRGFGIDERRRRTLRVVAGVQRRRYVAGLPRARARERRHDHAVRQGVASQCDRREQLHASRRLPEPYSDSAADT